MSLRRKLTLLLLVAGVVPAIVVAALLYRSARDAIGSKCLHELQTVTHLKREQIETAFTVAFNVLKDFQNFLILKENIPVLITHAGDTNHPAFVQAKKRLDDRLRIYQSNYGYLCVLMSDTAGRILYSSKPTHHVGDPMPGGGKTFEHACQGPCFSDVFIDADEGGKFCMLGAEPFKDSDGHFIGVVAIEIDMGTTYALLQDNRWLGRTTESYIGKREGDRIVYLSPLQYESDTAFRRTNTISGSQQMPLRQALVTKTSGVGYETDYRGKPVVAAWEYIPILEWGMVTKVDVEEEYAMIDRIRRLVIVLGMLAVLTAFLVAFGIARSVSAPIKVLEKGARIVGSGKLDHRVGTTAQDEVGRLSRTFDDMVANLQKVMATRDELQTEIGLRKATEEQLRATLKELERSNRDLEQFAYSASHDLQEPLRKVVAFGSLLQEEFGPTLGATGADYVARMSNAAERMQRLINDLLTYARVTTRPSAFVTVDMNQTLRDVLSDLETRLQETQGRVETAALPMLEADPTQMSQLLQNLIGNALKFHRKDVPPVVRVYTEPARAGFARLVIQDNGIGFEDDYAEKIFGVFHRLHGLDEYAGSGIGLAVCRRIVERHGGAITGKGEPQQGARFVIDLPLKQPKRARE